jgi:hypothetical protein
MYRKRSAFQPVSISAISRQLSAVNYQSLVDVRLCVHPFAGTHTGTALHFYPLILCVLCVLCGSILPATAQDDTQPTLADLWDGRAEWVVDIADVGLPVGESDTVQIDDNTYWSYLHASNQSAQVIDQCGQPVAFPGCLTRWTSLDAGQSFALETPVMTSATISQRNSTRVWHRLMMAHGIWRMNGTLR